ncbi:transferase [Candidatus Woesearchaeota archaeon]|nr:transferase [Candidatus Woesearchaeota archaeon]
MMWTYEEVPESDVDISARIYPEVNLGNGCRVEEFCVIGKLPKGKRLGELKTYIGDRALIRSGTIIYAGNIIGFDFQTGDRVSIRENNTIGERVSIGTGSEIAFRVLIGNNVRVHSGCHIFEYTTLEDGVTLNPGVFILNTKYPYTGSSPNLEPVRVRENARIGARVTLGAGITIGRWALIGADSLVTKSIPDYALAYGHPATVRGDIRELRDKQGQLVYKTD